jgi:hypothetical protein
MKLLLQNEIEAGPQKEEEERPCYTFSEKAMT